MLIKNKAASHVNRIEERIRNNVSSIEKTKDEDECGCDDDSKVTTTGSNNDAVPVTAAVAEENCGCEGDY